MLLAPLGYLLAYQLVERTAIYQLILELAAGGVGSFYQNEETLVFFLTYLDKGVDAVLPR